MVLVTPIYEAGDWIVYQLAGRHFSIFCTRASKKSLGANRSFSPAQHGFRSGLSCMTKSTELIRDVAFCFGQGLQVDEVLLDFKNKFDLVPPESFDTFKDSGTTQPPVACVVAFGRPQSPSRLGT